MIRLAHWRIVVVCIVSVLFSERNAVAQGAFYQATEQETAGPAGTLIRQEPMPFLGGKAFRILYRSTGMHDEPIAVSGVGRGAARSAAARRASDRRLGASDNRNCSALRTLAGKVCPSADAGLKGHGRSGLHRCGD